MSEGVEELVEKYNLKTYINSIFDFLLMQTLIQAYPTPIYLVFILVKASERYHQPIHSKIDHFTEIKG